MIAFLLALKIGALLVIIVLPLAGPKKRKAAVPHEISKFYVNENGFLEYAADDKNHHQPV